MEPGSILMFLLIGAVAGWLAGKITKGKGFGLLGNLIIGVLGALIGGVVFSLLGLSSHGMIGSLVTALAGAVLLLYLIGLLKK